MHGTNFSQDNSPELQLPLQSVLWLSFSRDSSQLLAAAVRGATSRDSMGFFKPLYQIIKRSTHY